MESVARVWEKGMTHFYPLPGSATGSLDPNMGCIYNYVERAVCLEREEPRCRERQRGSTLLQGAVIVPSRTLVQTIFEISLKFSPDLPMTRRVTQDADASSPFAETAGAETSQ